MIQHNAQNVLAAFDVLIEEMEDALRSIHKGGADALGTGNYERAQRAIEHARRVMLLCENIAALKGEWKDVEGTLSEHADPEQHTPPGASVQRQTSTPPAQAKPHPVVHQKAPPTCWAAHRWQNSQRASHARTCLFLSDFTSTQ